MVPRPYAGNCSSTSARRSPHTPIRERSSSSTCFRDPQRQDPALPAEEPMNPSAPRSLRTNPELLSCASDRAEAAGRWGVGQEKTYEQRQLEGCFRHQLLLSCNTELSNRKIDQPGRFEERQHDIPQHHEKQPR